MYYRIKGQTAMYKMMNEVDEAGVCQVLDLESNSLCLVRPEQLVAVEIQGEIDRHAWKLEQLREFIAGAKQFYSVG